MQQGLWSFPRLLPLLKKPHYTILNLSTVFLVLHNCKGAAGAVHKNMMCRQGLKNTSSAECPFQEGLSPLLEDLFAVELQLMHLLKVELLWKGSAIRHKSYWVFWGL